MSEERTSSQYQVPTGWKLGLQLLGFIIGAGLLVMIVRNAMQSDQWGEILDRISPELLAGFILCTLVSVVVNGAIFWTTLRPVRKESFLALQWVNLTATFLNFSPIRLGIVSRIIYHVRVDRLKVLFILGWFFAIIVSIMLVLGSATLATIITQKINWLWAALTIGLLACSILIVPPLCRFPFILRRTRGGERMITDRPTLTTGIILRVIDLAAFAGRIWLATIVVDAGLSGSDVLLIAVAAVLVNMNPLGRLGFRELAVAWLAKLLADGQAAGADAAAKLDAQFSQLSLVESAAEILVVIPLGLLATIWWIVQVRRGPKPATVDSPAEDAATS